MKSIISIILLMSSTAAFAAGDGHITDLIPPAFNFILLFGFMVFKLRGPISNYFTNKSTEVSQTYERAQVKEKEANAKLKMFEDKMANSDSEVNEIIAKAKTDGDSFEQDYKKDVEVRIEKMKADAIQRIKAEETAMIKDLNADLLNQVIINAKDKISSNSDDQKVIAKKLLGELS